MGCRTATPGQVAAATARRSDGPISQMSSFERLGVTPDRLRLAHSRGNMNVHNGSFPDILRLRFDGPIFGRPGIGTPTFRPKSTCPLFLHGLSRRHRPGHQLRLRRDHLQIGAHRGAWPVTLRTSHRSAPAYPPRAQHPISRSASGWRNSPPRCRRPAGEVGQSDDDRIRLPVDAKRLWSKSPCARSPCAAASDCCREQL